MSTLSLDHHAAQALSWVAAGAESTDHGSVLFIDVINDTTVYIYTNTGIAYRGMEVSVEDDGSGSEQHSGVVRAKALAGIADKVEEGETMSIIVREDDVSVISGATSMTLDNLYSSTAENTEYRRGNRLITVEAGDFIRSIHSAGSSVLAKEVVRISADEDGDFSISSGSKGVHTKKFIPATAGDEFAIPLQASHTKIFKKLEKFELIEDVTLYSGKGFVKVFFPVESSETTMSGVYASLPTMVSLHEYGANPCDEDINGVLEIDKSLLNKVVKPLLSAVSLDAMLTVDTTQDNRIVLSVHDDDGEGKVVIIDGKTLTKDTLTVPVGDFASALRNIPTKSLTVGRINFEESDWVSLSPVFDEAAETEAQNDDIIIAVSAQP